MATYMIHTYPKRLWYVEQYLIPSLLAQGVDNTSIIVYNDVNGDGNLVSCMKSFASVPDDDKGTWHIQDDVLVCRDFKKRTEENDYGLVCGFSSEKYDGNLDFKKGAVKRENMWFSFPCIRIPNKWARECSEWVTKYIIGNPVYEKYWKSGRNDDWAFRAYLKEFHNDCAALNIMPNLVDHIDYLIGGGSGGKRTHPVRSQYFDDVDLVEELENALDNDKEW